MSAPLQNRVDPLGNLIAERARGLMMGNRGGRLHRAGRTLGSSRWVSRQWTCCRLEFNNRRRKVWGNSYTELFFLDEVTALAAGHRPCFECRRKDAENFALLFSGQRKRESAPAVDKALHAERLDGKMKRLHRANIDTLPDGAVIALDGEAFAVRGRRLLRWTVQGYAGTRARPRGIDVDVLTPPSIVAVLKAGYRPLWHPTADQGGSINAGEGGGDGRSVQRK
jgi:hypothetical protein